MEKLENINTSLGRVQKEKNTNSEKHYFKSQNSPKGCRLNKPTQDYIVLT